MVLSGLGSSLRRLKGTWIPGQCMAWIIRHEPKQYAPPCNLKLEVRVDRS